MIYVVLIASVILGIILYSRFTMWAAQHARIGVWGLFIMITVLCVIIGYGLWVILPR
jgi:hypothetical protein